MAETSRSTTVSMKCQRIAELASMQPARRLTTLAHHIDVAWLREAYDRTRKDGAVGVDGQSATDYAQGLDDRLRSLLNRAKDGSYRAPPVRRTYIPKSDGRQRPLGIPTFEDKVLQRAVTMVLEQVYEQDFLDCSYGFRPGRSAHQALQALQRGVMSMGRCWVIDLDIRQFFDHLDHGQLRWMLDQRMGDGVLGRLIGKWLKAGVMEDGQRRSTQAGTPQGGVISPLLANIYLHHVLDAWFEHQVKPRMTGRCFLIRYADDAVLCFAHAGDAQRVMEALPKRLERFGLELHPSKTRLLAFAPPTDVPRDDEPGRPNRGTFTFLGFTHYWGRSRRGRPLVKRKTSSDRLSRSLHAVRQWCRMHRHAPVSEQHRRLSRKMLGHYAYYGITGNSRSLGMFYEQVKRAWLTWLSRRSQKARLDWEQFARLLTRYPLPRPRIVHSVYRNSPIHDPRSRMR